jgi:hypothetical protein
VQRARPSQKRDGGRPSLYGSAMTRAISLIIILLMVVQIIRPLGLPGLKKRSDFWKLAVAALASFMIVALTKGE